MRIAVLEDQATLSDYIIEILRTWGLTNVDRVQANGLSLSHLQQWQGVITTGQTPSDDRHDVLRRYVESGGTLIVMCPRGELANIAGLEFVEARNIPLRLRVSGLVVQGLAGECLPVPQAHAYRLTDNATGLAWLFDPRCASGLESETPGIIERRLGTGNVISFAFDLPRCVLLLRQGDPALADRQLPNQRPSRRMCKPSNMVVEMDRHDVGWIPFADLLGRILVDVILRQSRWPVPLLSTMPAGASGMLLLSGDEDNAPLADVDRELADLTEHNARMNMYIIPEMSHSTRADAERYQDDHDLGPHPDLVPLVDEPIAARVAEYERQIRVFCEKFNCRPKSIRNHAAGWAGYLDLVHVQHRCGIRMDLNYFSGNFARERDHSLFSPFGAALPMRFCEPHGTLIDVFQQHTHLHDDIMFAPDRDYSYKFTPEVAATLFHRLFEDVIHRFQTPIAANFHPGNWHFAGESALALIRIAKEKQMFAWSYDQWLGFWEVRDQWRMTELAWDGARLAFGFAGEGDRDDLCVELPIEWRGRQLASVTCDGSELAWNGQDRSGGAVARIRLSGASRRGVYAAVYQERIHNPWQ